MDALIAADLIWMGGALREGLGVWLRDGRVASVGPLGSATPERRVPGPCRWDAQLGLGLCGDGFTPDEHGPRVEAALLSGWALATRMAVVDLVPSARELDIELGWSAALSPMSSLRFGIARAFDAGHVAGAIDTAGYVTLVLR